jgi:ribonuclease VapC
VIAVDTSALIAIVLKESEAGPCVELLSSEDTALISAGTLAEALIVAAMRNFGDEMEQLVDGLGLEVEAVTPATARRMTSAYRKWGKGIHPAALNFGDCFAYAVAKEHDCPLLFVGEDFARTDVANALGVGG